MFGKPATQRKKKSPKCIYCLRDASLDGPVWFNTEHVVPTHLVRRPKEQPVLRKFVCACCNASLGGRVDKLLTTNEYSIALEFAFDQDAQGGRHSGDLQPYFFKLCSPEHAFLDGAPASLRKRGTRIFLELPALIAMRPLAVKHWKFKERRKLAKVIPRHLDKFERRAFTLSRDDGVINAYADFLAKEGFIVEGVSTFLSQEELLLIAKRTLLCNIHRAVTKIAFNYVAWNLADQFPSFVFERSWQYVRDYVRWDECPREFAYAEVVRSVQRSAEKLHELNFIKMEIDNVREKIVVDVHLLHFDWRIEFNAPLTVVGRAVQIKEFWWCSRKAVTQETRCFASE